MKASRSSEGAEGVRSQATCRRHACGGHLPRGGDKRSDLFHRVRLAPMYLVTQLILLAAN